MPAGKKHPMKPTGMNGEDAYYDAIASGYDRLHQEEQRHKLAAILANMHIRRGESVIDVGCGTNANLPLVHAGKKVGIDPSMGLLRQSLSQGVHGKAEALPFKDKSFDYAISLTAIHLFDDIDKGLREMLRVARKGVAITVLKKSKKADAIRRIIARRAFIHKTVDEDKDTIYFLRA